MKYLLFAIVSLFFISCGGDPNDSVWDQQMWLAPLLTGAGAVIFAISAYRSAKSATEQQVPGQGTVNTPGKIKWYKLWQTWFSAVLAIATIVIIVMVNSDK